MSSNTKFDCLFRSLTESLGPHGKVLRASNNACESAKHIQSKDILVVKPFTPQAIPQILNTVDTLQNEYKHLSVYPISTGKNWGYGSATPSTKNENAILLDMSLLNEVTFFDAESGVISVQPGVTQQQLYEFLQEQNAPFMVPVTGAGPSTSILGNALERGYGITPVADHFTAVTAVKGYLADGSFYESSLQAMSNASNSNGEECYVDKTFKWKHGPYLDGIFTQSGNMVVTEVTIALARKKPAFDSFYMRFFNEDSFETAYGVVQDIFQNLEGIVGSINLMDKRRVAAMVADNPQGAGNHAVMTSEQVNSIAKKYDVPEWTVVGTIYGTKAVAKAAKKDIKRIAAKKADQLLFSNSLLVSLGKVVTENTNLPLLSSAKEQLEKLSAGIEVMQGKPSQVALPLAYWRNPRIKPDKKRIMNPAEDGCGLLWYAPLVPAKVDAMRQFVDMIRTIAPRYNVEPMITFTNLSGISTDSTIPIVFDKENPQAVEDAHNCLDALYHEGLKRGFVPYRLNIKQQQELDPNSTFWKTAGKIAHALDPKGIISPDRYNPHKT
ncbi:FAD-binding protein [Alteromonas sp.]|uniref:FAD-binding oxidoreductase n=1 Tax=Alteromonas sp. TaxID=232 RepID=UPI000B64E8D9|nr:FAD-binding protein [Alteromonas sp.]MAI36597.1 FAD-binding oxidoreductase [Alteromonas sp.]OUX90818.1 MAG: FAD-binding oxidoreductase [Alteromonas sp. TMED35]|tara:strand:- start:2691 stop:4349 length:1659 start_codon:yes stop_codon:yes gene_type:complete